jgi:hypothetical protein
MEVSRAPSRWPWIVALSALLVFCLTVPRIWRPWQGPAGADRKLETTDFSDVAVRFAAAQRRERTDLGHWGSALTLPHVPVSANGTATADALWQISSVEATPEANLDDLIATLNARASQTIAPNVAIPPPAPESVAAMPGPPTDVETVTAANQIQADVVAETGATDEVEAAAAEPLVAAAPGADWVSGSYSPLDAVPRWVRAAADAFRPARPNLFGAATDEEAIRLAEVEAAATATLPTTPIELAGQGDFAAQQNSSEEAESTLRLADAGERLAFNPPRPAAEAPVLAEERAATPSLDSSAARPAVTWSEPETLLWQLERLKQHSETSRWADNALAQLDALRECDPRNLGSTAAVLESLRGAADEAVDLAAAVDAGLRVELMRAHWGLVRRLDCWTAMHGIRLAAQSDARFASRGSLGSLFRDATGDNGATGALVDLSAHLEEYERTRDSQIARQVTDAQQHLQSSSNDLERALSEAVDEHYRNANVRVAVTPEMLSRFVGDERVEAAYVFDRIAGTPIRGQSETISKSNVVMQPAVGNWWIELQTQGVVNSDTSSVGRARVFTHGSTRFSASTPVIVGSGGIQAQPTTVAASNCNQLVGVMTGVDWVPLVGALARNRAVEQYREKRGRAKVEVEYKVASRAMARLDAEAEKVVGRVEHEIGERFTSPLAKFGIEVVPLELSTTKERATARLRIAGPHQLAAHTPRPQALSDSLASAQIHESALTNAAVALELNGERMTASQLQTRLREKLPRLALEQPPEAPDDTIFQFAAQDAVAFRVADGRLELALAIAEFAQAGQRTRNFVVHAFYVPVVNGLSAELVRDGVLGIDPRGGTIGAAERARLHNVFKVVLAEERRLPILRPEDPADPRFAGLMITQLVLEDGWLGVSIGPAISGRVTQRQRSLQ